MDRVVGQFGSEQLGADGVKTIRSEWFLRLYWVRSLFMLQSSNGNYTMRKIRTRRNFRDADKKLVDRKPNHFDWLSYQSLILAPKMPNSFSEGD
jgi:hypothetical protein